MFILYINIYFICYSIYYNRRVFKYHYVSLIYLIILPQGLCEIIFVKYYL